MNNANAAAFKAIEKQLGRKSKLTDLHAYLGLDSGFLLTVEGDCPGLGLSEGDMLVVKINMQPADDDIVVTSDHTGAVLFRYQSPSIRLVTPDFKAFKPRSTILGVVDHVIQKIR